LHAAKSVHPAQVEESPAQTPHASTELGPLHFPLQSTTPFSQNSDVAGILQLAPYPPHTPQLSVTVVPPQTPSQSKKESQKPKHVVPETEA
jgi:hypothetical protein